MKSTTESLLSSRCWGSQKQLQTQQVKFDYQYTDMQFLLVIVNNRTDFP